jgi:DNA phosphorothioation-associated putative methyltransferase
MFAAGDSDELEIAAAQLDFGFLDPREGHFTVHRTLLDELPVILRVYVECAARLYGNPREADLIKIHLHSRKLTFHYYRDFDKAPLPELLTRIKIDLRRLFVTVIDHTNGAEHQLLFFKERFLAKDHPDRPKMDRFSAKLRKLGLREETIGYGPSKEKWEEFLKLERGIHPAG